MREPRLNLVLLWHMHQPDYRDAATGQFMLPWVYLHALKDYSDMAAHVERHPRVRAVFNFVPVLLEQVEDYVRQFDAGRIRDPLLGLLQVADLERIEPDQRSLILENGFAANHRTMLEPYPPYLRLHELYLAAAGSAGGTTGSQAPIEPAPPSPRAIAVAGTAQAPCFDYLSGAFLGDLLAWYHLAWIGETERRADPLFGRLMAKGAGFSHADRLQLFEAIGRILRRLIPRYRALAERGCIELSTTPHTHPLAPLLIDFGCAREAQPQAELPLSPAYPGGLARVRRHLDLACLGHEQRFGAPPAGMWPAEGAVSDALMHELGARGLQWAASSEAVLANSLGLAGGESAGFRSWLYRPWRHPQAPGLSMMFRDERLSDLIGFEYARWHGRDAAAHLVAELEAIGKASVEERDRTGRSDAHVTAGDPDAVPVVLIALDGENAWEYYPYNGYYFFEELYARLEAHPWITTTTMREAVSAAGGSAGTLPRLVAGSWVMGTLSTWIGEPGKNRAWDLLCEAKAAYDGALARGTLAAPRREAAERQLATCESSDWFWWLGPYNSPQSVGRFERLFRHNLRRLYELIGVDPPLSLDAPISAGQGRPEAGGAMRRAHEAA